MNSISRPVWNAVPVSNFSIWSSTRSVFRRCKQQGQSFIDQRADVDAMLGGKLLHLAMVRLGDADMKPWIARHVLKLPSAIFLGLKVVARDLVLYATALLRRALFLSCNIL